MTHTPFNLLEFPLEGLRLIEASAGTGKTFSLAGLYLRLLVEKQLDVRDILVMTFTRAATQELRERIRTRLANAALIAADPAHAKPDNKEDEIALSIIERAVRREPRARIAQRLRDAAVRMDDATISTIHSFAQHAALENAFDSGLPFDRGTQVDDVTVQHEAVTDYWRSQVFGQSQAHATAFLALWPSPSKLEETIDPALKKPHLQIWNPDGARLHSLTDQARELWSEQQQNLLELLSRAMANGALLKAGSLNNAITAAGGVAKLLERITAGLAGTAVGYPGLPAWLTDLATEEDIGAQYKKAKEFAACRPSDSRLLLLLTTLAKLTAVTRIAATSAALDAVRTSIRARKRAGRQFSFADMIESLHEAIVDPLRGADLATALHHNWPYALVDEIQDTDPLQYEILRRIYKGRASGALVMIGDPKQAIYAFRGGDVFAYLQAARDADGCYNLDTNFRSTQGVLNGIQSLFLGASTQKTQHGPFLLPEIDFHTVKGGRKHADRVLFRNGSPIPSITAWTVDETGLTAEQGRQRLLDATVSEICGLLDPGNGARERRAGGEEAPVRPGDIAVLVNSNREAASVQRSLARHGIAAVCLHRDSVFKSQEAQDLLHVLRASDSTARLEILRAALCGPLMGLRMGDLLGLAKDEAAWQRWIIRFQAAHEDWRARGVLALLEPMLQDAAPRLLALDDGERRMTNYLQLAELLAEAETATFGATGLIRWLAEQIADPEAEAVSDARQLRLESDDALVRIATIHKVKGLQYPIVFVPFTPSLGAKPLKSPWVFHDASSRAWLDLGLQNGLAAEESKSRAMLESRAESLRLLYVALTRAEQACYIGWGAIKGAQNSALAWLLHNADGADPKVISGPGARLPVWFDHACVDSRLAEFAGTCAGAVGIAPLPIPLAPTYRVLPGPPPDGKARDDLPRRRTDWSVFSFSRLVAGGKQPVAGTGFDDESRDPLPEVQAVPDGPAIALRGAAFGVAVHGILETIDPSAWPVPGSAFDTEKIAVSLRNSGVPLGEGTSRVTLLGAVSELISRTLHTPLPHIGPLALVPARRRLVEMEFFLKLGGERTGALLDHIAEHGYGTGLSHERRQQVLNGLMQGFVDLVVEADGRYWIIDYKTNDLGVRAENYTTDALRRAVRHGHYDLQYLIYLVALHRHLELTLRDYEPDLHLGGAQYLFLRGMNGSDATTGVFIDRPPTVFIQSLDALFAGRSRNP